MRLWLAAALLFVPGAAAAADPRKDALETAFWKIVDASKSPEFLMDFEREPGARVLAEEPRFEFAPDLESIAFSCRPWGPTAGGSPALATFCEGTPVVAFGKGIFAWGVNEHGWAWTAGHELAHLLFRHPGKRTALRARQWAAWRKVWVGSEAERAWKEEMEDAMTMLRVPESERTSRLLPALELKFLESAQGQAYLTAVREQEAQADHWAVKLVELAGYDPKGGYAIFKRAMEQEPPAAGDSEAFHYPADIRAWELKSYAEPGSLWTPPPILRK